MTRKTKFESNKNTLAKGKMEEVERILIEEMKEKTKKGKE
jgi:hypothetical protein